MKTASKQAAAISRSWFTIHPISSNDQIVVGQMRAMVEPFKGKLRGVAARIPFNAIMGKAVAAPDAVTYREDIVGGVGGWWCEPVEARPGAVILHAHGGWFTWGSGEAFRNLVGHIAHSAKAKAFVPDYRLAPEHPFPAAIEDLEACYRGLVESGAKSIALTGDSAGGNLALLLLSKLAAKSPAIRSAVAAVALSPVTDLTTKGISWNSRANADPYFVREQAEELVRGYLGDHDPSDPLASPLYGDLAGLPPIRVHVGDDEVLLDDSTSYVERAVAAGVDARVEVWEGMPHGFAGAVGRLDAANRALSDIGKFLLPHLGGSH
jgi:monoterpene epsilon-lactone hydrolase